MQLPRGTFREIRKGVVVDSLLRELEGERFSGVANISSPTLTATLVFKGGKCILVKVANNRGDAAWDELQNVAGEEVDAALSLLGDAQVELALEFNKPCRILKAGRQAAPAASRQPAPAAAHEHPRTAMAHKAEVPFAPLKPPLKPAPSHHHAPAPPAARQAPVHAPPSQPPHVPRTAVPVPPSPVTTAHRPEAPREEKPEEPRPEDHDTSSFEADLDTFDTMDIDNVTDKIRTDCKTMIKQLHLDHLMER